MTDKYIYDRVSGKNANEYQAQLYTLAHDIKGPLNRIRGLLDIARKVNSLEEIQQYLEMAIKANQNVSEHIRELLDGHYAESEKINIGRLISECWDSLIENHGVSDGMLVVPSDKVHIINRRSVIKSIFQNILENAIKYSKPGIPPCVHVTYHAGTFANEISIRDNGIGIRSEDIQRIFDPSYQEDNASNGHGIGLFLVKQHLANIGGMIDVQSEYGTGTTFTISL